MKILRGSSTFPELGKGVVATIGNFDGLHTGHQALLRTMTRTAKSLNFPSMVILFEPQPCEFFYKEEAPARLTNLRDKVSHLAHLGVDFVYCIQFGRIIASLEPQGFIDRYLFNLLNVQQLWIGQDFRFGKERTGNVDLLQKMFKKQHRLLEVFSDYSQEGIRVSSTEVRLFLKEGRLHKAKAFLGRHFSLSGRVMHGDGRGRQWGIPTANIKMHKRNLPLKGVFCVRVKREDGATLYGVANIGCRPTIDGTKNILEVHMFDFNGSLYGENIEVEFLHKIRDEEKFSSIDVLVRKIKQDIQISKQYFELYLENQNRKIQQEA